MNNKLKIILVTGFLGSGKTTLLNRLIEHYKSQKIGLIINDFGQIAIDGILLSNLIRKSGNSEKSIYEISNGSIFCSCLSAELVNSLKHFAEIKPDILLIETSGLSDPSTFGVILKENKLDEFYDIEASFCIIDAVRSMKLASKIVAIEKQIQSSNILVINKCDLISDDEYYKVENFALNINNKARIIKTTHAKIDLSVLNKQINSNYIHTAETCNTVASRPGSIVLRQQNISLERIEIFYELIKDKIFRIKGFLEIDGKIFYISDNNNKLIIQERIEDIKKSGLSVLLPEANIELVESKWLKFRSSVS